MLKVVLVDDEKNVRAALKRMLELYADNVKLCATCANLSETFEAIKEHQPDVLLLDVEIGSESGFDIFKHYPTPDFKVNFVTAYQQYAVQAFRFSALDYLLKPVNPDLLIDALKKAAEPGNNKKISLNIDSFMHNISGIGKESKKIVLKTSESIFVIKLNEIFYCEAEKSYTSFYLTNSKRIVVSTTLGDYDDLLAEFNFVRVHQSYLVNFDYVSRYDKRDGGHIILTNDASIPVSARRKDHVLEKLNNL